MFNPDQWIPAPPEPSFGCEILGCPSRADMVNREFLKDGTRSGEESVCLCQDHFNAAVGATSRTILAEAEELVVSGDRRQAYGPPRQSCEVVAQLWSAILKTAVTPEQVCLCMIALKIAREMNSPKRDNRVDMAGYAQLLDMIQEK